ncbi:Uncharacterised protein [Ewingella americana]|uniref:Uncharacterized protein n=1 Tax=Ewingella americana TaxID=41202 RepID=A0A377NA65_9GAMM|nr:Uncharacterised protein [Ewingella americana]
MMTINEGAHGHRATHPQWNIEFHKALHHHLPGQGANHGGREARGNQTQAKGGGSRLPEQGLQREVSLIQLANALMPAEVESRRGGCHHRQIDKTGDGHGNADIQLGGRIALPFDASPARWVNEECR